MPRKKSEQAAETPLQQAAATLNRYIEERGMRHTPERLQVLETLLATDRHFTVDELADKVAQSKLSVCRSTVVNTLKILLDLGMVLKVGQNGRFTTYMRAPKAPRKSATARVPIGINLQCTRCGAVREVRDTAATLPLASRRYKSFIPASGVATIFGLCSKCKAQENN